MQGNRLRGNSGISDERWEFPKMELEGDGVDTDTKALASQTPVWTSGTLLISYGSLGQPTVLSESLGHIFYKVKLNNPVTFLGFIIKIK